MTSNVELSSSDIGAVKWLLQRRQSLFDSFCWKGSNQPPTTSALESTTVSSSTHPHFLILAIFLSHSDGVLALCHPFHPVSSQFFYSPDVHLLLICPCVHIEPSLAIFQVEGRSNYPFRYFGCFILLVASPPFVYPFVSSLCEEYSLGSLKLIGHGITSSSRLHATLLFSNPLIVRALSQ